MINTQNIGRFIAASALATGLLSMGIAASAQTTATPAPASAANATTVSMATTTTGPSHKTEIEQINADARRVAFRNLGTSL